MTELTVVIACYGQPLMMRHQIERVATYSEAVQARLNYVIVDDCGKPPMSVSDVELLDSIVKSARLFRVTQDIPWNQMGARNLGMHHSSGVCVMLDPDMLFDAATMSRMIEAASKLPRGHVAKFVLRHKNTGKVDNTSPNTWMLHRDDFFAVGGYDEDFAGNKGWSDVQLQDVLQSCYKIERRPDLIADFYSTNEVPDAMVTSLDRSTALNRRKRVKKVEQARKAGGWAKWAKSRKDVPRVRFAWEQLYPTP